MCVFLSLEIGQQHLFALLSPTEAYPDATVWDFDMTLFIVFYSLLPGLQRSAREREREGKKKNPAPFIYALIFPPLWWMAFLLCHLGLWKMFSGAEEIASFHIIQIQLSARAISMLSACFFFFFWDIRSSFRSQGQIKDTPKGTWLENITIYNFPILVSWLSRVLKVSRLFWTLFCVKAWIKSVYGNTTAWIIDSYTVIHIDDKQKENRWRLTWNLSGGRIYKTRPSQAWIQVSDWVCFPSWRLEMDSITYICFRCPYWKWSLFSCFFYYPMILPVF